jgi:PHD/YefM family antitoxin component YafN of YafNO toxin-antitoxin module
MKVIGNTQFFSVSEAKADLPRIVERLQSASVLLRRSEPVAALVSIEQYNDYLALEKLVQHPELFDRLREQARKARTTPIQALGTLPQLEAAYRQAGQAAQAKGARATAAAAPAVPG